MEPRCQALRVSVADAARVDAAPSIVNRSACAPLSSWASQPTRRKRRARQRRVFMRQWEMLEFIRAQRVCQKHMSEGRVVDGATLVIGAHRFTYI